MAAVLQPTYVMCECPCHDPDHPLQCSHNTPCCCPHRFLVALDCPDCTEAAARNRTPLEPLGERTVPTLQAHENLRRTA